MLDLQPMHSPGDQTSHTTACLTHPHPPSLPVTGTDGSPADVGGAYVEIETRPAGLVLPSMAHQQWLGLLALSGTLLRSLSPRLNVEQQVSIRSCSTSWSYSAPCLPQHCCRVRRHTLDVHLQFPCDLICCTAPL